MVEDTTGARRTEAQTIRLRKYGAVALTRCAIGTEGRNVDCRIMTEYGDMTGAMISDEMGSGASTVESQLGRRLLGLGASIWICDLIVSGLRLPIDRARSHWESAQQHSRHHE